MSVKARLSLMMFLQFFIWGAWFPLSFDYLPLLGFSGYEQAWIQGAFPIAALVGMFFSTQFADRNFAAEKFLAFSHLIGGACILALFWVRRPDEATQASFPIFFTLMLIHSLFYVPTISITNAIAFANLKDPQNEFGPVRLWGTIGWIAAAWPFVFILADWANVPTWGTVPAKDWIYAALKSKEGIPLRDATAFTYAASGVASLLLAALSLTLPHTPPKPASATGESLAWLEAVKLLRHPFVLVLFVVTFIDAAVHQMYFFFTASFLKNEFTGVGIPGNWVMPIMSIGQIAEILTMAVLGMVLKNLGWRTTMIVGILGHAARFAIFAFYPQPVPAIAINVLHGVCYAFFFATVYIFIDEFFPKDARSSAQGLFNFLIFGAGPFVGNFVAGMLGERFTTNPRPDITAPDFAKIFQVPMFMAIGAAVLLLLFFHPPKKAATDVAVNAPAH